MAAAFGQGKLATNAGGTSIVGTFNGAVAVDDLIWICVGFYDDDDADMTITGVTDTAGNTYTPKTLRIGVNDDVAMQSFLARNISSAAHTVTAAFSSSVDQIIYMGMATATSTASTAPHVSENYGSGTGVSSVNAGSVITSAEHGINFSMVLLSASRTISVPTGYTSIGSATRGRLAYQLSPTADTYPAVWSWTGGNSIAIAVHDAFRTEPAVIAATHIPYNLLNTRTFNHGYSR